jgi:putative nucleotidyltransferase with HDIG domain
MSSSTSDRTRVGGRRWARDPPNTRPSRLRRYWCEPNFGVMSNLSLVDESSPQGVERSAEMDEALLALRSGAWLTVAGVLMLFGSSILNQLGDPSQRLTLPTVGWIMLGCVLLGQVSAVVTVEVRREWIRNSFSVDGIYNYLWTSSMVEGVGLAIGVVLVPAAVVHLSLMMLMMVVFAGYFYRRWQAISFMVFAPTVNTVAVVLATPPAVPFSQFTPAAFVPFIGVTLLAGAFVAVVRRGRDRVERRARIVATVGLARALDLRDTYTADHSGTVARYAAAMATSLGLAPRHVERVRVAGLLHDVGKIGIPDAVLLKPAKLTEAEWVMMRRHPELGAQMLDSTTLRDVRRWVLAHHERPDGKGYPYGLRGDDIPLEARIIAIADAFEAMTADRVYRSGMPQADAIAELRRCAGTQFDPEVVEVFVGTLRAAEVSGAAEAA